MLKLGSLFDGSGGFPLAGSLCGIEPVWAAEVEPYPIAVTRTRFPKMKHLGDISKVNGAEIEPVDIITFGSPCQDLSVAGKRAGLKHEECGDEETTRSGLFMEAVRIIKEMRGATHGKYPSIALWENVPGAFSSNKGEDFRTVLEELIKIAEPNAVMPEVPQKGWPYADSYIGDGWSIAYRLFDAQYWGVAQRRRRIHLIADFRNKRAGKILFEREGLRGDFKKSCSERQSTSRDVEESIGADDSKVYAVEPTLTCTHGGEPAVAYTLKIRSGCEGGGKGALIQEDKSATLATNNDQYLFQPKPTFIIDNIGGQAEYGKESPVNGTLRAGCQGAIAYSEQFLFENHSQDTRYNGPLDVCPVLASNMGMGGNNAPFVVEKEPVVFDGANITSPINKTNPQPGDPCHTLSTDSRNYLVKEEPVYCLQGNGIDRADTAGCNGKGVKEDIAYTLNTIDRHGVCYTANKASFFTKTDENIAGTLVATDYKDPQLVAYGLDRASFNQGENAKFGFSVLEEQQPTLTAKGPGATLDNNYIVRRLTPTECARLQGFPDRWGDIEAKTDFTDEEYEFWLDVRNTHAAINGKQVKDYTKAQMMTWYNKLHTDSAEYKMWGNGIALPPALYCMEGIVEALEEQGD